ncbi:MAG: hypothetical protein QOK29_2363 [Rhodospirillaceae bacterium]|jgi:hypothetical protein|nr:hypothetical protein [Rhodospirillaceae bacterium]
MFQIEPAAHRGLAAEFKARPFGPHNGELQRVLNLMRAQPLPGRYALLTLVPHREWGLVRLGPPRGGKVEIVEGVRYHSPEEAEWDVFKRRWQELTGQPLGMD